MWCMYHRRTLFIVHVSWVPAKVRNLKKKYFPWQTSNITTELFPAGFAWTSRESGVHLPDLFERFSKPPCTWSMGGSPCQLHLAPSSSSLTPYSCNPLSFHARRQLKLCGDGGMDLTLCLKCTHNYTEIRVEIRELCLHRFALPLIQ